MDVLNSAAICDAVAPFAKAQWHTDRNTINPAAWDDNLKYLLPKQPKKGSIRGKHKSLPYAEMPAFMVELRALTAQSAKMLEVGILTCVRTTEVVRFSGRKSTGRGAAG